MKIKKGKGISLIVLVITIIVIIILTGAVILNLANNNPIFQASKAAYLTDLESFKTELELYKSKQFMDNLGSYNPVLLQADNDSVTYNNIVDTSKTMNDLIPSLLQITKYSGQFQVIDGKLIYGGLDTNKQDWTRQAGLEVVIIGEPKITILAPSQTSVERGTNIVYTVKFSSNLALTTINLVGKLEVLDNLGVELPVQPTIVIGAVSGINTDTTRQVDITITTDNLLNGTYKLKIKPGVVTNSNNKSNTIDIISLIGFEILDNIPPINPTMLANPTGWTNGSVSVTISYSADSVTKEYSTNGTTWSNYTVPVIVTENAITIYARGKDIAENESGVSTLTVANIDKTLPIIVATNSAATSSSVTVTATASDIGGSGIAIDSYQYSKDNGTTWTIATSATSYTFTALTTGIYQCKAKVADITGNSSVSSAVAITTTGLGAVTLLFSPTVWTNGSVAVTITYPAVVVTKQYSTNGTTWNTYTAPVTITTNNTTVYAKGLDAGGNQTTQATLTVSNIDTVVPVVSYTADLIVGINSVVDSTFLKSNTTITDNVSAINQININNIQVINSATSIVSNTLSGYDIYTINYSVADGAGNIKGVSRTMITKPLLSANLTNILPDPSFELGSAYWYNAGGEVIRSTDRAYSGSYSLRVYSNAAQNWPRYNYDSYNIQGKAIYARTYTYKTASTISPGLNFITSATTDEWPVTSVGYADYSQVISINQWNSISITILNAEYPYFKIMLPQTNPAATGYVWFDGLMVIDLTASFGSNVPTGKWMDRMIPYFSGSNSFSW